ncbi:MAG: helix-turn-helix domain-containing protein [Acidimicrobiales bacterium]
MPGDAARRWHDLGEFIREQRGSARLSLRRLSELAGISNPYLSQIERGLRRPSAEILQQIARALRISAETLYVQAGILEPRGEGDDLTREILADSWISEDQKQVILRIYRSFRQENTMVGRSESAGSDKSAKSSPDKPPGSSDQDHL